MFIATSNGNESESATSSCRDFGFDDFLSARGSFAESLVVEHGGDDKDSERPTPSCHHFEFHDILSATENFDESLVIGQGGFGKVYKGNIITNGSSSVVAAIKRLDTMSSQGAAEFWAEVEILSKLRHCNLVSLIGYCNHRNEKILVYEYMSNGTLEDHLYKLGNPLSWLQRLKICIGAGRGLHYLHTGTGIESGVIHRDIKSSNILLHESWTAKIADFGLSKIGPTNQPKTYVNTLIKGTFGYLDPDYYATGKLTRKSDVYAFGVVMLELLCRRRALDRSLDEEQMNLARWVLESIKERNLKHIVDYDIRGEIAPKCLKEFVQIAERCLHTNTKQRLTMAQVLFSLENVLIVQKKYNNSLQPVGRTLLARMVNMLPFTPTSEDSDIQRSSLTPQDGSKISTDKKGKNEGVWYFGATEDSFLDTEDSFLDTKDTLLDTLPSLKIFDFDDLRSSTRNFSPDLVFGEGGFGKLFLARLEQNTFIPSKHGIEVLVAVKKFNQVRGHARWQAELSFLGRLAHPNIITLIGHSSNEYECLLVYEYMPNKSFDCFLNTDASDIAEPLSWKIRLRIMIGVARGLVYLHSSKIDIIYRHLKSSTVLLDKDFNAKLVDFTLAKSSPKEGETHISTRVMGTYGYADPAYVATGHLTVKSDIFSFGVVLLEALTGLRVFDEKRETYKHYLVDWAIPILGRASKLKKIMDPRLKQNYPVEGASKCGTLALRCLSNDPINRPSSEEVLENLEQIYATTK
uniref:probable serine/threonine-protein kinase PBL9 n=1 Tax=Erigeron canadensis TaxID=72917 RepID=UPI001CB905A3|nr:probable serine/threonine-protein kinase PBL9 [Erigeron canadensis]